MLFSDYASDYNILRPTLGLAQKTSKRRAARTTGPARYPFPLCVM